MSCVDCGKEHGPTCAEIRASTGGLDDAALAAIEARANAAPPAPWIVGDDGLIHTPANDDPPDAKVSDAEKAARRCFIAAAREDVPRLIAEIRRLRTLIGPALRKGSGA